MTKSVSHGELSARLRAESVYQRGAARWVAAYNKADGAHENICRPSYITDVRFAIVGAYHYSEMTYDFGSAGLAYVYWEERQSKKRGLRLYPCEMEVRWSGDVNAGAFVEQCVALLP